MAITVNESGALYELDTVHSNENGVLYELDTVHSNENGVLYEIHSSIPRSLEWISLSSLIDITAVARGLYIVLKPTDGNATMYGEVQSDRFYIPVRTHVSLSYERESNSSNSTSNAWIIIYKHIGDTDKVYPVLSDDTKRFVDAGTQTKWDFEADLEPGNYYSFGLDLKINSFTGVNLDVTFSKI